MSTYTKDDLLALIRNQSPMTMRQQLLLTAMLSAPAIMAQLSSILMQYIDASMLGRLGAMQAASVGLVSTTTWLFGGLGFALSSGFAVQVAHLVGANDYSAARSVVRQALVTSLIVGVALGVAGMLLSPHLPVWLGGGDDICRDASVYFLIYAAAYQIGRAHV